MAGKDLRPKYKASHLLGKDVADHIKGTRLAAHLMQIRDRFGTADPLLKRLATKALSGGIFTDDKSKQDIFSAIGDRLATHGSQNYYARFDPYMKPELKHSSKGDEEYMNAAKDLAEGINWDRVGHAVQLDDMLAKHIKTLVPHSYNAKGQTFHVAQNWFKDKRFKDSLIKLVSSETGPKSALGLPKEYVNEDRIRDSLERLTRRDEYIKDLVDRNNKQLKETRPSTLPKPKTAKQKANSTNPIDSIDSLNWLPGSGPAFTQKGNKRVRNDYLDAEQYKTNKSKVLYGMLDRIFKRNKSTPTLNQSTPLQSPNGIAFTGGPTNDSEMLKSARAERQAIWEHLKENGIPTHKANQYIDAMRNHYESALPSLHKPNMIDEGTRKVKAYKDYLNATTVRDPARIKEAIKPLFEHHAVHTFGDKQLPNLEMFDMDKKIDSLPEPTPQNLHPETLHNLTETERVSNLSEPTEVVPHPDLEDMLSNYLASKTAPEKALPVEKKAPKAPITKAKEKDKKANKEQVALAEIRELQKKKVPEQNWIQKLTAKKGIGITAAKALSAIKKFHKLKLEDKEGLEPLKLFRRGLRQVLKYGVEDFNTIFKSMNHHDFAGNEKADNTKRGVLADAYEENTGDTNGANLLRTPGQAVINHEGKFVPGVERHYRVTSDILTHPTFNRRVNEEGLTPQHIVDEIAQDPNYHGYHHPFFTDRTSVPLRHSLNVTPEEIATEDSGGKGFTHIKQPSTGNNSNRWSVYKSMILPETHAHHSYYNPQEGTTF